MAKRKIWPITRLPAIIITGVINPEEFYSLKTQFIIQAEGSVLPGGEWLLIAVKLVTNYCNFTRGKINIV